MSDRLLRSQAQANSRISGLEREIVRLTERIAKLEANQIAGKFQASSGSGKRTNHVDLDHLLMSTSDSDESEGAHSSETHVKVVSVTKKKQKMTVRTPGLISSSSISMLPSAPPLTTPLGSLYLNPSNVAPQVTLNLKQPLLALPEPLKVASASASGGSIPGPLPNPNPQISQDDDDLDDYYDPFA